MANFTSITQKGKKENKNVDLAPKNLTQNTLKPSRKSI
jgi:hypothetical protein